MNKSKPTINPISLVALILILAFYGMRQFGPKLNTSWVVDEACTKAKSNVYQSYGEIPRISGQIIYQNQQNYIVAVKYSLPDGGWKASCACHVYGYRESNVVVLGTTNEMSYDYNYKASVEELKALWAID